MPATVTAATKLQRAATQEESPGGYTITTDEAKGILHALLDKKEKLAGSPEAVFALELHADMLTDTDKGAIAYSKNFLNKYVVQAGKLGDEERKAYVSSLFHTPYETVEESVTAVKEVDAKSTPPKVRDALLAEKKKMKKEDSHAEVAFYEVRLSATDKTIVAYVAQSINNEDSRSAYGTVTTFSPTGKQIDNYSEGEC